MKTEESLDAPRIPSCVQLRSASGPGWPCAFAGTPSWTPRRQEKQRLMEAVPDGAPGFDFSGAEFNGEAPDAATFMEGVPHK